jgi:phenylacetate-CoA ligase
MDELTVRVERRPETGSDQAALAGEKLATRVKHRIGVTVLVAVEEPEGIERSMGKARRVIDNRAAR